MPPRQNPFGRPPLRTPGMPARPRPQLPNLKFANPAPTATPQEEARVPEEAKVEEKPQEVESQEIDQIDQTQNQEVPTLPPKSQEIQSQPPQEEPKVPEQTPIPGEDKPIEQNTEAGGDPGQTPPGQPSNPPPVQPEEQAKEESVPIQQPVFAPPKPMPRPQMRGPPGRRPNPSRPQIRAPPLRASPFGGPAPEAPKVEEVEAKAEEVKPEKVVEPEKPKVQNPFGGPTVEIAPEIKEEQIEQEKSANPEPNHEEQKSEQPQSPKVEQEKTKVEVPVQSEIKEPEPTSETPPAMTFDEEPIAQPSEDKDGSPAKLAPVPSFQTSLNDSMTKSATDGSEMSAQKKKMKKKKKKKIAMTHRVMMREEEDQVENLIEETGRAEDSQAKVAKLTKENLDSRFSDAKNFNQNDIETESVLQECEKGLKTEKVQSASQRVGEQILNNAATIKSVSQSNVGQEPEKVRRLQDALASQREQNQDLNQKLIQLQSENQILLRKQALVQEDSEVLRDQVQSLKREHKISSETAQETVQSSLAKEKVLQKQLKDKDEHISQLNQEVDNLKQERDLYKDRMKRALRESQTQREHLERSIQSNSDTLMKNIRSITSRGSLFGREDEARLNTASNQQEINLQREISELKKLYEKQLRETRQDLMSRTRDLQKVERKNAKYRENNRILTDAVQNLENRNLTAAAGSGSNQNDFVFNYQTALQETNEDLIETMGYDSGEVDVSTGEANQNETQDRTDRDEHGLYRASHDGAGYFDNTQDEATGGEGHSNMVQEEEKINDRPPQLAQTESFQDQQSALGQESNTHNNQSVAQPRSATQNNNQSEVEREDANLSRDHSSQVAGDDLQTESGGMEFASHGNSGAQAQTSVQQQVNQIQGSSNMNGVNSNHQEEVQSNFNNQSDEQSSQVRFEGENNDRQSALANHQEPTTRPRAGRGDDSSQSYGDHGGSEEHESHENDSRDTNEFVGDDSQDEDEDGNTSNSGHRGEGVRQMRVPEAGSGNFNERQGFSGGANSQKTAPDPRGQPSAISAQRNNMRQTGSSAGGTQNKARFSNQSQRQFGTGSSGASGVTTSQRPQREEFEEQKWQGWSQDQADLSGSGAGVRGRLINNESGSRRCHRQQNQQPSSGANGDQSDTSQSQNNRQGRQGGGGGGRDSSVRGSGAAPTSLPRGNSQNDESKIQDELRGRSSQQVSRGRQKDLPLQTVQGQNALSTGSQQQSAQTQSLQPAPVSLSQEREMYAQSNPQTFSSVQAAVAGSGGERMPQRSADNQSQAVQQVQQDQASRRQNPFASQNNQSQQFLNAPASTQSNSFIRDNFSQGAAQHSQYQSSQMIPASTASHSGNQFVQSAAAQFSNRQCPSNIVSFESGSTSFIGSVSQPNQPAHQFQVRGNQQTTSEQNRRRAGASRVPFTQLSQVSSPPSNQIVQSREGLQRNQQSQNSQQDVILNEPNSSDNYGGPGAVGAPPSTQNHSSAVIKPSHNDVLVSRQNQNVSPGSSSGPSQAPPIGFGMRRPAQGQTSRLPSVPENQYLQQSVNTVPSSVFGQTEAQNDQMPAALRANNQSEGATQVSEGGDQQETQSSQRQNNQQTNYPTPHRVVFNRAQFESQNTQGSSQLTPPRRNNDSRKTSGANTPNKEGASTPTTHQSQSFNLQNRGQGRLHSAVNASLNQHLAQNESQVLGGNQQNYVHNLTNSDLFAPPVPAEPVAQSSGSIIDQLSAAASGKKEPTAFNPASLFDDLGSGLQGQSTTEEGANAQLSSLFEEESKTEGC